MLFTLPRDMGVFEYNSNTYLVRDLIIASGHVEEIDFDSVSWMLYEDVWSDKKGNRIRPYDVLKYPEQYPSHRKQIENCDLSFPIIVFQDGNRVGVADGCHRLAQAFVLNHRHILARTVNLEHMY